MGTLPLFAPKSKGGGRQGTSAMSGGGHAAIAQMQGRRFALAFGNNSSRQMGAVGQQGREKKRAPPVSNLGCSFKPTSRPQERKASNNKKQKSTHFSPLSMSTNQHSSPAPLGRSSDAGTQSRWTQKMDPTMLATDPPTKRSGQRRRSEVANDSEDEQSVGLSQAPPILAKEAVKVPSGSSVQHTLCHSSKPDLSRSM